MALLILDNYDSFTYNLVHLVEQYTDTFEVIRNDQVDLNDLARFDRLLISPGPGLPSEAGQLRETLAAFAGHKPVLGVCLGMQAIVEHYGGRLYNLPRVKHGISSRVTVCDRDDLLFRGLPAQVEVGHYHSWAASRSAMSDDLQVTALGAEGEVMAITHRNLPVYGVQFHPESIMTGYGPQMIANWMAG